MVEQGQIRKWKKKEVGRDMFFSVIDVQLSKSLPELYSVVTIRELKRGGIDSFYVHVIEDHSKLVELTDDRDQSDKTMEE